MGPVASAQNRGVKRKRTEQTSEDPTSRVQGKLHHSLKEVKKAAKKAKTFELQKLVKKLKGVRENAQGSSKEVTDLEAQLHVLKNVDHDRVGCLALKNKLKKDKVLSKEPSIASAVSTELPSTLEPASAEPLVKVEARLFSSKALSSEVNAVIVALRAIFKPTVDSDREEVIPAQPVIRARGDSDRTQLVGGNDESTSLDELTAAEHEEPAAEDAEDDGWESGTVDGDSPRIPPERYQPQMDSDDEDASDESDTVSLSDVSDTSPRKRPKPASPVDKKAKVKGLDSTFLPSLAVGFTRGDSDTDWSDSEAKHADSSRKNRRGQRARRAIWEKKYGKGAKHLTKGAEGKASYPERQRLRDDANKPRPDKNAGHGARQQSTGSGGSRPFPPRHGAPHRTFSPGHRSADTSAAPRPSFSRAKPQDEKPLHPSWEAKKKLKEKESAAIVPAQGKRIKFDD
ncbi:Bud-site selection protein [Dentipellis sp. KUC8613]|nr:Bud-site selection protein [Dentipellis sp. KUC8613]